MFPLKLIGAAVLGGAALGVWASGVVKEKLGGGAISKVKKSKTEVVYLDPEMDTSQGIRIIAHKKKAPEAKIEE